MIPKVVIVCHVIVGATPVLVVDSRQNLSLRIYNNCLWIVLTLSCLVEWVICSREGKSVESTCQIAVEERHVAVHNRIDLAILKLLARQSLRICSEFLLFFSLNLRKGTIQKALVFARKRTDFRGQVSGEKEVDNSFVFRFDGPRFLPRHYAVLYASLDRVLLGANTCQLRGADAIFE